MNIGVIGSEGRIGQKRIRIIKKLYPDTTVLSFDIKKGWYGNYKEFINSVDLDGVFVCVPHTKTTDIVAYCLKKQIPVFAEKPPGICMKDIMKMKPKKGEILKFGFNHRFYPHVNLAKKKLSKSRLGKIYWMRGMYGRTKMEGWRKDKDLAGKGILLSQGIHMVDLILYLGDDRFHNVQCIKNNYTGNWFEDNVFLQMQSVKKNISAFVHSSSVMGRNTFELMICGEKGYIRLEGLKTSTMSFGFPMRFTEALYDKTFFYGNPCEEIKYYGTDFSWDTEVKEFIESIKHGSKIIQHGTWEDAKAVMEILEEVYKNDRQLR